MNASVVAPVAPGSKSIFQQWWLVVFRSRCTLHGIETSWEERERERGSPARVAFWSIDESSPISVDVVAMTTLSDNLACLSSLYILAKGRVAGREE